MTTFQPNDRELFEIRKNVCEQFSHLIGAASLAGSTAYGQFLDNIVLFQLGGFSAVPGWNTVATPSPSTAPTPPASTPPASTPPASTPPASTPPAAVPFAALPTDVNVTSAATPAATSPVSAPIDTSGDAEPAPTS